MHIAFQDGWVGIDDTDRGVNLDILQAIVDQGRHKGTSGDAGWITANIAQESATLFVLEVVDFSIAAGAVELVAQSIVQLALFAHKQDLPAKFVALFLVVGQQGVQWLHSIQQALRVQEGKKGNSLPGKLLAVEIHGKVLRVEVDNGRVLFGHERMEGRRDVLLTASRQHSHELLDRVERLTKLKLNVEVTNVHKVRCEG